MENREIKITITLKDLKALLEQQKELTGEVICRVAHQITVDGKTDTSIIRNEVRNARYPNDIKILEKYLTDGK